MIALPRAAAAVGLACLLLAGCGGDPAPGGGDETDVAVADTGTDNSGTDNSGTDNSGTDAADDGDAATAPGAPQANGEGAVPAPGAPKPKKKPGPAPGSPMRMPARTIDEGVELGPKLAYINDELRKLCGGIMCVNVVVEYSYPDRTRCQYMDSDPAPDSTFSYEPNMTIRIIAGSDPCTPSSSSSEEGPSTEEPVEPESAPAEDAGPPS